MAENGSKQPLLAAGLLNHTTQANRKKATKRRRFRRCKSAPLPEFIPPEPDNIPLSPSNSFLDKLHPSFINVAVILTVYLGVGTVCFYIVRHQIEGKKTNDILDAIYFCIVTMTTVGYGDLVPSSAVTKLLACGFVFSGMALIGLILSKGADYLVEKQEMLLVKALHLRQNVGPSEIMKEVESKKVRYKCLVVSSLLVMLIIGGTIFLVTVEKLNFVDAFYCVCSTITTLGYGDKSFSTESGRVFAIFWILTSTLCLAQFFLYLAELNTENRQKELVQWVLTKRMTNVDLEAADLDDDGNVGAAEFVIYKLKEMGKISQEDIAAVMEEFENLDVDQSGTLSVTDLALAQSSTSGK